MTKIRLDLEDLEVETFETVSPAEKENAGTVYGLFTALGSCPGDTCMGAECFTDPGNPNCQGGGPTANCTSPMCTNPQQCGGNTFQGPPVCGTEGA